MSTHFLLPFGNAKHRHARVGWARGFLPLNWVYLVERILHPSKPMLLLCHTFKSEEASEIELHFNLADKVSRRGPHFRLFCYAFIRALLAMLILSLQIPFASPWTVLGIFVSGLGNFVFINWMHPNYVRQSDVIFTSKFSQLKTGGSKLNQEKTTWPAAAAGSGKPSRHMPQNKMGIWMGLRIFFVRKYIPNSKNNVDFPLAVVFASEDRQCQAVYVYGNSISRGLAEKQMWRGEKHWNAPPVVPHGRRNSSCPQKIQKRGRMEKTGLYSLKHSTRSKWVQAYPLTATPQLHRRFWLLVRKWISLARKSSAVTLITVTVFDVPMGVISGQPCSVVISVSK